MEYMKEWILDSHVLKPCDLTMDNTIDVVIDGLTISIYSTVHKRSQINDWYLYCTCRDVEYL